MQSKNHEEILFESIYSSFINNLLSIYEQKGVDFILGKINKNRSKLKSICLLPYWFSSCFENENNIDLQNELFILGKISLQSYISHTLYEYIRYGKIDKEYINLNISIANILSQKSIKDLYELTDYNKDKINIINNLSIMTNGHYLDNKTISDIHYHFKYLCDNSYKRTVYNSIIPLMIIWLLGNKIDSNNHIETFEFFKNYLISEQLSNDDKNMCDDMLNNTYTPATFLMRAQYSSDYIHTMMRSRIDMHTRLAIDSVRNLAFFDHDRFMGLYMKEY
jgi:hypothetical protein